MPATAPRRWHGSSLAPRPAASAAMPVSRERRCGDDGGVRGAAAHRSPQSGRGGHVIPVPQRVRRTWRGVAGAVLLVLAAITYVTAPACAHQVNISTARVELRPQRVVAVEVAMKGSDV